MPAYVTEAFVKLLMFDLYLMRGNFPALYRKVRNQPLRKCGMPPGTVEQICSAVDLACIWYWKHVLCLQRSASTTCLLRKYGVPAQLVIGVQQLPFRAHAWVEVDGRVVNDKPYMAEKYVLLDRC